MDFSFDENVVKTLLTLKSNHPDLVKERGAGGKVERALARDPRLREVIEKSHENGFFDPNTEIWPRMLRVFYKMTQGLYFGLYKKLVSVEDLNFEILSGELSKEEFVEILRPPLFRDITDNPLPEITEHGWVTSEPVFFVKLQSVEDSDKTITRLFRIARETPVEWITLQEDVFTFGFVKNEDLRLVCVIDLWKTWRLAVSAPWPDDRGPLRRGKRNILSRDK